MLEHRNVRAAVALVGLGLIGILGCSTAGPAKEPLLVFPSPPDAPRIQYLTWASGAKEVGTKGMTLDQFLLGDEATDRRRLNKPYGLAARDGSLYVADSMGLCVARLDFKNKSFSLFGARGPGRLKKPLNIAIDSAGYKFVADSVRKQVVVFGPNDAYVNAFSFPEPCHPVDVAIWGDELFVLDNDTTPQVLVLDRRTGDVIRSFGEDGKEPGQFHLPVSIAVGPEGNIHVSDTMNWRIQKLTPEGESLWVKGVAGYGLGQFARPRGIRVGPDGIVYIVDGATEIVQMFNSEGQLLMHFGGPGVVPGTMLLPSSMAIDKSCIPYFTEYVHEKFNVDYLLFVANQYGDYLINIYAFGSFPEGYQLDASMIAEIPDTTTDDGIGAVDGKTIPEDTAPTEDPATPGQPDAVESP